MTSFQPQPHEGGKRSLRRSYLRALGWVAAVWLVAVLLLVIATLSRDFDSLNELLVIALASGGVACLAMLPGLMRWPERQESDGAATRQRLAACLFAGMAIRLAGTVALFLSCRYHMATSTEMIAGMTIGWYVLLTSVEVFVLARELPKTANAPKFAQTSLG